MHYANSLVKHIASTLANALSKNGCSIIDCCGSWLGDLQPSDGVTGLVDNPGRVLFAIHADDLIVESFVRSAVSANMPLFAVISADPEVPYYDGGIDYEYDPQQRCYRGRSEGKGDTFTYSPSPFAKYYSYSGEGYGMVTIASFASERLVLFS